LTERGIEVDHVTVFRWVERFTPLLADAARPCRHAVRDRWYVDETYVKVAGRRRYVYGAVDQHGHIIDVYVWEPTLLRRVGTPDPRPETADRVRSARRISRSRLCLHSYTEFSARHSPTPALGPRGS
jgi:hypothetical protein